MVQIEITLKIQISDKAYELLKTLEPEGAQIEYRDSEYNTYQDFLRDHIPIGDSDWFNNRNAGGTFEQAQELLNTNLINFVGDDCWYPTFEISDLGRDFLEQVAKQQNKT